MKDLQDHIVPVGKVLAANGLVISAAWFEWLSEGLTFCLLIASLTYTLAKLYELFTGKFVKDLLARWR